MIEETNFLAETNKAIGSPYVEDLERRLDIRVIELDNHMAFLQENITVKKCNENRSINYKYWNYENILKELKPLMEGLGLRFIWSQEGLESHTVKTQRLNKVTGAVTDVVQEKLFLKMGLSVGYKGVRTETQYGYTDITVSIQPDSSQAFGAHEAYLKKRLLANVLMVVTNEARLDPDGTEREVEPKK